MVWPLNLPIMKVKTNSLPSKSTFDYSENDIKVWQAQEIRNYIRPTVTLHSHNLKN
jgi:hypothetical protein